MDNDQPRINDIDPIIAEYSAEWSRHRKVCAGAARVVASAAEFLPRPYGQTDADYKAYVGRVPFYPAAARAHQGLLGLILAKPPTIKVPDSVTDVVQTITKNGYPIQTLARQIASDILITNYGGLLIDYPSAPAGLDKASAKANGVRPYISFYPAEAFLAPPEMAEINNRQRTVRVRLFDDAKTIRELRLDDQIYSVTIHRLINNEWIADEPITPTRQGKPLDEIPFELVTDNLDHRPGNATLNSICDLNISHYLATADYKTLCWFAAMVIYTANGVKNDTPLSAYPGAMWRTETLEAKFDTLEPSGQGISDLKDAMLDVENKMATSGLRILENPKAAVEAAETIALRRTAENAVLASVAILVSEKLTEALKWVAYWMGLEEGDISFACNTDYNAIPLTPADRAQIVAEWQAGLYSKVQALELMVKGEALPSTFDREVDQAFQDQEIADRPPTDV